MCMYVCIANPACIVDIIRFRFEIKLSETCSNLQSLHWCHAHQF